MIISITPQTHHQIKNPLLAEYAAMYLRIYDRFMDQVRASGIGIDPDDHSTWVDEKRRQLVRKGAIVRNNDHSIYINAISPACVACRKGVGSATFYVSLRCHRDCYYCFNPNQVDYEFSTTHERDLVAELDSIHAQGQKIEYLALTGGEPLLHKEQAVAFFDRASAHFPESHKRLYTTGDQLNETLLRELHAAGLKEIRFSIRMHDSEKARRHTLDQIALAKQFIPDVMVEMPILPGTLAEMQTILLELNQIGIFGINLLEFCFPMNNAAAFNGRGFRVKQRPFETLYSYWYAGGVPVSGSEQVCLELLDFAIEQGLTLGVHYCSLENKFTGQNYQQNAGYPLPRTAVLSHKDFMLKSAKAFGDDIPVVRRALEQRNYRSYEIDSQRGYLEFHVNQISALKPLDVEIGISTSTLEQRAGGLVERELKIDLTTPRMFKLSDVS
ncbi:MAG: radical SAM protein [Anaerolinea sp.]|nr:radical SAM protein [Anaerolinea sp.]